MAGHRIRVPGFKMDGNKVVAKPPATLPGRYRSKTKQSLRPVKPGCIVPSKQPKEKSK